MTTVTRRTPTSTCTTRRTDHACTLLDFLFSLSHASHPHWLKSSLSLSPSSPYHPWWTFLSECFDLSFYFHPHFLVLFLSFLSMHVDSDLDSMTSNLRDSAKGSFVTHDDFFPLTQDGRNTSRSQEINVNSFNWRQYESQCWAVYWQNGATCCYSSYSRSTRRLSSLLSSWRRYAQRGWWSTS